MFNSKDSIRRLLFDCDQIPTFALKIRIQVDLLVSDPFYQGVDSRIPGYDVDFGRIEKGKIPVSLSCSSSRSTPLAGVPLGIQFLFDQFIQVFVHGWQVPM